MTSPDNPSIIKSKLHIWKVYYRITFKPQCVVV